MTLEEILEKLHSPTEHAITLENGELTALLEELKELREENERLSAQVIDLQLAYNNELVDGKKAKRLLKLAVEDIKFYVDCYESHCDECCCDHDNHCHWKHEAEVLALIGGNDDENGSRFSNTDS